MKLQESHNEETCHA